MSIKLNMELFDNSRGRFKCKAVEDSQSFNVCNFDDKNLVLRSSSTDKGLSHNSTINNKLDSNTVLHNLIEDDDDRENAESVDSGLGSGHDYEYAATLSVNINSEIESLSLSGKHLHRDTNFKVANSSFDKTTDKSQFDIRYTVYESEHQMPDIMRLITKDLSEPYSIYTYRYFIHNWPKLCLLALHGERYVGAIVCKLDVYKNMVHRGYIAMLAIDSNYRRQKIVMFVGCMSGTGSTLVTKAIHAMIADDCDEVVLETEISNKAALRLYENLGFIRDKRLFRYYLNGEDALRLKLWLR